MELPFRIEKKDSFHVVGYEIITTNKKGEGRKTVPALWSKFKSQNLQTQLLEVTDHKELELFGISIYNTDQTDPRIFRYLISASCPNPASAGLSEYVVPARTWAIFPCTIEEIGKTESLAITKWLPKSKYKPLNKGYFTGRMKSGAPDIEHYDKNGNVEIWVAVAEK